MQTELRDVASSEPDRRPQMRLLAPQPFHRLTFDVVDDEIDDPYGADVM